MKNQKMLNVFNRVAWLISIGLIAYFLWTIKTGCNQEKFMQNREKPENLKKNLKRTGPFLFWRGDSLDVHTVDAGFMQYYKAKQYKYNYQEAMNTSFDCYTQDNEDKISFKIHPIETPPSYYDMPEKMLVFTGYASNFKGLKKALISNGVIDKVFNWTFGTGHLVLVQCPLSSMEKEFLYWLIYKLEQEAHLAGGKIHVVLGQNPFHNKEKQYRSSSQYRPDFFKLQNWDNDTLFQKNSELGRWIYSKNVVEKIGDYLISAAGINQDVRNDFSMDSINNFFREIYQNDNKNKYGQFILTKMQQQRILKEPSQYEGYKVENILNGNISYATGEDEMKFQTQRHNTIDRFLNLYKAKHIISHFPRTQDSIFAKYDNKYIGTVMDFSPKNNSIYINDIRYEGLWIENKQAYIVDDKGKKRLLFKDFTSQQ